MLKARIQTSTLLVTALFYLILGFICLTNPSQIVLILYYFLSYGLIGLSLLTGISARFTLKSKRKQKVRYYEALVLLVIGIWVLVSPLDLLLMIPYLIGVWGFIIAAIRAIDWYVYFHDKLIGTLRIAIEIVLLLGFSIMIFIEPITQSKYIIYLLGGAFIIYGHAYLQDFIGQLFPKNISRKRKIALPVFMNTLLPHRLVLTINQKLSDEPANHNFLSANPTNATYDIEIFIHLGVRGFDSFGHVDIAFGDIVMSYGNHDSHSTLLHGIVGDGVVFFAERAAYIKMIVERKERSIVAFGIKLTSEEKRHIKQQLISLATRFQPWLSDQDRADIQRSVKGKQNNYASSLTRHVHPKFFKFSHGKFKTYFVMTTNCVLLAETIVGKSSIDLISIDGMITPGTYYDYLNSEFQMTHSIVVSRHIYTFLNINEIQVNIECKKAIDDIVSPVSFIQEHIFLDGDEN